MPSPTPSGWPGCGLFDALGFLSRIGPAAALSRQSLGDCVRWFGPAGIVLGLLLAATAGCTWWLLSHRLTGAWGEPILGMLCGVAWLTAEIWVTRGMHWDGVADLCDALGSPGFWEVLKDSRMGTFGALGTLLVFAVQWVALAAHVIAGHWTILVLAPAWGRSGVLWLGARVPPHAPDSLGGAVAQGIGRTAVHCYWAAGVACAAVLWLMGLGWMQSVLLLAGQWLLTRKLAGIARDKGGLSGDFFGAAIEGGQVWFLLATL